MIRWIRSYLVDFTCLLAIGMAFYFITDQSNSWNKIVPAITRFVSPIKYYFP